MALVYDFASINRIMNRRPEKIENPPLGDYLMCFHCSSGISPNEPRVIGASGMSYVRCTHCGSMNNV